MNDAEKIVRDRALLMQGRANPREMALLYMDRLEALSRRHRETLIEYEGKLMHKEIQIDRLLDRIHYLLNEAEGKGVMLDAAQEEGTPDPDAGAPGGTGNDP